jgi:hypothetical protein
MIRLILSLLTASPAPALPRLSYQPHSLRVAFQNGRRVFIVPAWEAAA